MRITRKQAKKIRNRYMMYLDGEYDDVNIKHTICHKSLEIGTYCRELENGDHIFLLSVSAGKDSLFQMTVLDRCAKIIIGERTMCIYDGNGMLVFEIDLIKRAAIVDSMLDELEKIGWDE